MTDPVAGPADPGRPRVTDILRRFVPLPYQSVGPDGRLRSVNDAWLDQLQYERDAVIGEPFVSVLSADSAETFHSWFPRHTESGGRSELELTLVRADGTEVPVVFESQVEYGPDGEVVRTHCQFRDISAQRRREAKLRETRDAFEGFFHGVSDAVFVHDLDGHIRLANETAWTQLGYSEDELVSRKLADLAPAAREIDFEFSLSELGASETATFETELETNTGAHLPVEVSASHIEYAGSPAILSVLRDISDRREQEQDTELWRTLVEQATDAVFVLDERTGAFVAVNQAACEVLGYEREALLELSVPDISARFDSIAAYLDHLGQAKHDTVTASPDTHLRADGSTVPMEMSAKTVVIGGDRYRIAVGREISERIERERALRRMQRAVDASGHVIYVTDPDGTIEYVNGAFESITGYSEADALGATPRILNSGEMDDSYFAALWETLKSGDIWEGEVTNRRQSGERYTATQTIAPIFDTDEEIEGFVAIQNDITDRKRHETRLEKRERILRELHSTTQDLLAAESESAVFEGLGGALEKALELEQFAILEFDAENGCLEPTGVQTAGPDLIRTLPQIEPGDSPLWNVFQTGETRLIDPFEPDWLSGDPDDSATALLVVPIGGYGVILAPARERSDFEAVDIESVEIIAGNAEAIMARMRSERRLHDLSEEVSTQETRVEELETLIGAIETTQQRLAESETKESLQEAVCEELVGTPVVDFAWIAEPQTSDENLEPSAWAGRDQGYLDAIQLDDGERSLPALRAAAERTPVAIEKISSEVSTQSWAREALSRQFNSVLSIPLVHKDVLYGVLTVFSGSESAFTPVYQNLFEEVTTLLANYLSILNIRYADSRTEMLEITFRISDSNYPLHMLAATTGVTVEFETVLESMDETIRILVSITDGEPDTVLEYVAQLPSIEHAEVFGAPAQNLLDLRLKRPFLATEITDHGGRLIGSRASPEETTVTITLPNGVSVRPLAESLANRYDQIELLARRRSRGPREQPIARPADLLTERQYEILNAAFFGGYYESPRDITGEELAASFGISNSVVHGHINAGHKRILEQLFDTQSDNEGLNS